MFQLAALDSGPKSDDGSSLIGFPAFLAGELLCPGTIVSDRIQYALRNVHPPPKIRFVLFFRRSSMRLIRVCGALHLGVAMKKTSVLPPDSDEDIVSDSSLSNVDEIASNDTARLKQKVMYLKGTIKAKDDEMTRLRQEKDATMTRLRQEKDAEMESRFLEVGKRKRLTRKLEKAGKKISKLDKKAERKHEEDNEESETEDELEEQSKEKESAAKLVQTELSLNEAIKKISILKTQLEHKCQKEVADVSRFNSVMKEISGLKKEKAEQAIILVQMRKDKEQVMKRAKICKQEMEEGARKLSRERQEKDVAIQSARKIEEEMAKMTANTIDLTRKTAAVTSKLTQTLLSLEEAVKKISDLETKLEKVMEEKDEVKVCKEKIEERVLKLSQELKEKEAAIQLARKSMEDKKKLERVMKNKTLALSVWKSSRSKVANNSTDSVLRDVLNCAPLKSGTFEWKIRVHSNEFLQLGVISSSLDPPINIRALQLAGSWCDREVFLHEGKGVAKEVPKFTAGCTVRFVLNLTGRGTLYYSVDESPMVSIFCNMKPFTDSDKGFLPATSMWFGNKIELIELKCRK